MSNGYEPTQHELEAFIRRAGFTYGWVNLESWARRMAEQACIELRQQRVGSALAAYTKAEHDYYQHNPTLDGQS